ncbi:type II secretion system protein [Coraliomargarita algicola]|uniref:Type II secretion system protein n=1 Tax=Coraliomargarita algicola TaxID=3092156 RepID=A0ABZ0RQ33_9BACT|nr:type II secretion system protein [Coraliomargarita sp. J2-16]WPJ97236.1 type II secretion system protein [Coraliomargarita sp. J2-16]
MSLTHKNGFTLIELLAGIVIVAILLSILIPVASNVLHSSRQVRCASNMRQLFLAVQAYGQEHNGQIIASLGGGPKPEGLGYWIWTDALQDYLEISGATPSNGNRPKGVLACPGSEATVVGGARSDYAINGHLSLGKSNERFQNLVDPAATICLIEGKNPSSNTCVREIAWWSSLEHMGISFQHEGTANAVFFDGHVESLSSEQLPVGSAESKRRPWAVNPL